MPLRAIVVGAGWAGEGHTIALREAGVEVVALCGRTPEPAYARARQLGIDNVRFDWRAALEEFRPEIVSIATPGGPHHAITLAAAQLGCHIMCDKPLAINAAEAREMLLAVEQAGVKHAYGPTSCYSPAVAHARALVADGLIGQAHTIESIDHFNLPPLMTYNWVHQLGQGGGLMNNGFTHKLAQALRITGGEVRAVAGEARRLMERAPAGAPVHDFRDLFGPAGLVDPEQAAAGEWRDVDVDLTCTVLARIEMPGGDNISAIFHALGMAISPHPDHLAVYGTKGALVLTGPNSPDRIQHVDYEREEWVDIPIPSEVLAALPQVEDYVQRDWNQLFREFVADVRGEGYAGYPTFRDGWIACEIMDHIRSGQSWIELPRRPELDRAVVAGS